jgi:catechol 2,3-dioxygenase-like lactoylglutathione lyase family enzyme
MPRFERVTPILSVSDVDASIAYYQDKLGFADHWHWGDPVAFGGVSRDEIEIFFCRDAQGSPGTWMSIWVDDVDALHQEFQARGADIVQPPTTFDWSVREMNVRDPDGHRIRFSMPSDQPGDGVPLAED